jgi:ubiquinone/menaquinone biosynthesis C-methylase UbiE
MAGAMAAAVPAGAPSGRTQNMTTMPYETFSRFYDLVVGDRRETAAYIRGLIADHKPGVNTLLELARGTGAILKILSEAYDVVGLDVSPQMLSRARTKLPHVRFFQADMVTYRLFEETIKEISFPLKTITDALRTQFTEVTVIDPTGRRPSSTSDRLYFVCRR